MKTKLLIVDDELEIISFMRDSLEDEGYHVLTAYNGEEALKVLKEEPNLIILDVMMPGMDGFELCKLIRKNISCPILFLSAKQAENDRVQGLLVGGDDYLVKPFSMKELKTRIFAHLRREKRTSGLAYNRIHFGTLTIDLESYQVIFGSKEIPFTTREFEIIQYLAVNQGQVLTRDQIYEHVWGLDAEGDASTITEHIKKIRAKLAEYDPHGTYISTLWGVGYRWER